MRWTRLASGMLACRTKTLEAYGEVVWSWRRDPGATLAVSPAGNGGKKGRFPGESTYKPSNHCAGKAGMSRLYLSNPCAFFTTCTRCCGRSQRPVFPAPSFWRGSDEIAKLRRSRVVRMSRRVHTFRAAILRDAAPGAAPQMRAEQVAGPSW